MNDLPLALLCAMLLLAIHPTVAQDIASPDYAAVFPPSPTATSLGRFGDVPVSLYTGTPSVSVPLWTLRGRDINLPISLSYHAGGVKVDDVAPPVGLNWALNATGVVTRVTMGLADDAARGYLRQGTPVPEEFTDYTQFEEYANGFVDSQPDIFHFALPGVSGKFILNHDGRVLLLPVQKVDVRYEQTDGPISRWIITTAEGIVYTLDQKEQSKNTVLRLGPGGGAEGAPPTDFYTSSWFLSAVTTPRGETITFTYEDYELTYRLQDSETRYTQFFQSGSCLVRPQDQKHKITTLIRGKRLTQARVSSSGETVVFHYERERADLEGDQALTRIEVKNLFDATVKEFALDHQYLEAGGLTTIPEGTPADDLTRRLMLTGVTEYRGAIAQPPYRFEYVTRNDRGSGMPARLSFAQDHWGYYNGQNGNTTLCPYQNVTQFAGGRNITFEAEGGNRSSDASSSIVGTLNKVTYPTGGHTRFDYGSHAYYRAGTVEVVPRDWTYTVAQEFETEERIFEVDATIEGKARINFTYSNEFTFEPSVVWMRIDPVTDDPSVLPVYYSEGYFDENSRTFQEAVVDMPPGRYEVSYGGISQATVAQGEVFDLRVSWRESVVSDDESIVVGGPRISRTTDYDPVSGDEIVKRYQYVHDDGKPSGSLVDVPQYGHATEMVRGGECFSGGQPSIGLVWVRSPTPNYTLGMTQGSPVGYSQVTVLEGEQGENGRRVYRYTSPSTHPDVVDRDDWPPAPNETREWERGLLEETAHYEADATDPLSKTETQYRFYDYGDNNPNTLNQYVSAAKVTAVCLGGACSGVEGSAFEVNYYRMSIGYTEPVRTVETLRNSNGAVTTTTDYIHSSEHLQPTQMTTTDSEQRPRVTNYQYAADFTDNTYGSQALRQAHMHSQVLEQTTMVDDTPTRKLTTTYSNDEGPVVPTTVQDYPTGAGEAQTTNYLYDAQGNVRQVIGPDGVPTAFVWGYDRSLPVAQVVGATFSQVEGQLGSDFHAGARGLSEAQAQTLRSALKPAQVTTYTYDPGVGMTSQTDANGRTTTYSHDALNRLEGIKNDEGQVVQKLEYHYAQP